MLRYIKLTLVTLLLMTAWGVLAVVGALEGWWHKPLTHAASARGFFDAAVQNIDANHHGNAAFVLLKDGRAFDSHFVSVGPKVDADTLFQVASLSKWISAWGVMALAEDGKIDLDAPVSRYLTRWKLPASEFDNDGVTVRRLLSHTAGLTDGLGYGGFAPGEKVQTLEASLTKASDASPGKSGAVKVGMEPGSEWKYSGGGYTLLQLLVEEASGQSFDTYMKTRIFAPLGMTRSTYVLDGQPNVAVLYGEDGKPAVHYRFTSLAATSLYTNTNDMLRFIQAHLPGKSGESIGRGVLSPETVKAMRHPEGYELGAPIWGMGVMLYAPNNADDFIAGHDGNNEPAINTAVRFDPASGDGIVLLETGNKLLATELAGEWTLWRTGNLDFLMVTIESRQTLLLLAIGEAVILLGAVFVGWRMRRRSKARP